MNEESSPQYAEIEQPFGVEPPQVHCPICGRITLDSEGSRDACDHLAFIYSNEGGFQYASKEFRARKNRVQDGFKDDDIKGTLKAMEYGNEFLALEITFGGMACGPVWYTETYGFDYGTLAK